MKQKGFTLIELLAVIVILAVIALIATPMILGVIESSKKGSAESSAYGYLDAVEQYVVTHMMTSTEEPKMTIGELNEFVSVKGEKPSKGSLIFGREGYIEGAILCINGYYVDYKGKKAKVDMSKSCDEIKIEPNKPMLLDNMIPVVYENNKWVKADESNWYDYDSQKWANAVTVKEPNRTVLLSSAPGTIIPMDDINLMFVWIPRYEYKIEGTFGKGGTSITSPGEIEVNFIGGKSKDASSSYTIHPGFKFGNTELTGFWVGKFEVSKGSNLENDDPNNKIEVKPNVESWRASRIATMFTATRYMELAGNPYGFAQTGTEYHDDGSISSDSNSFDTHLIKNKEWGAVAYLTQSNYGKYGNSAYSGANKEIYMNNYNGYRTGCSSGLPTADKSETCANEYDAEGAGTGASTTGTIYGIYDMNGGAWEGVMATYQKMSGYSLSNNSGFNGLLTTGETYTSGIPFPDERYYDLYTSTNMNVACSLEKCLGDGVTETRAWYEDHDNDILPETPWTFRGGSKNEKAGAGVFAFTNWYGDAGGSNSFRVILSAN